MLVNQAWMAVAVIGVMFVFYYLEDIILILDYLALLPRVISVWARMALFRLWLWPGLRWNRFVIERRALQRQRDYYNRQGNNSKNDR